MNVFVDMHHHILYKSLQILFEERLGWNLYRPIGVEWFEKGYWQNAEIYNHNPDTIKQFLEIRTTVPTKMGMRNEVKEDKGSYYVIDDPYRYQKALTFDQFMEMKPDIVIASYYGNIKPYLELAKQVKAKHIMQMGNMWPVDWSIVKNLMSSTIPLPVPKERNAVFYHQEIDLKIFKKQDENPKKLITSFVHCLPEHDMHKQDWQDFQDLEDLMGKWQLRSYGISCRDGIKVQQQEISDIMRESKWGFHCKGNGDGFGHVIHDWFAVGRPVIYRGKDYFDKLAGRLLVHKVTGLDLDKISLQEAKDFIENQSEKQYAIMCDNVYKKFKEQVDFDKEEILIKKFLDNLLPC